MTIQARAFSDHFDAPIEYIGPRRLAKFNYREFELGAIPFFLEKAAQAEGATIESAEFTGQGMDI